MGIHLVIATPDLAQARRWCDARQTTVVRGALRDRKGSSPGLFVAIDRGGSRAARFDGRAGGEAQRRPGEISSQPRSAPLEPHQTTPEMLQARGEPATWSPSGTAAAQTLVARTDRTAASTRLNIPPFRGGITYRRCHDGDET